MLYRQLIVTYRRNMPVNQQKAAGGRHEPENKNNAIGNIRRRNFDPVRGAAVACGEPGFTGSGPGHRGRSSAVQEENCFRKRVSPP
jgi:hypothetical protein